MDTFGIQFQARAQETGGRYPGHLEAQPLFRGLLATLKQSGVDASLVYLAPGREVVEPPTKTRKLPVFYLVIDDARFPIVAFIDAKLVEWMTHEEFGTYMAQVNASLDQTE